MSVSLSNSEERIIPDSLRRQRKRRRVQQFREAEALLREMVSEQTQIKRFRPEELPIVKMEEECAICYTERRDKFLQLPCSHLFHSRCLKRWLEEKENCPICRNLLK